MRILFVALPSNIHTLRWISQLTDRGWDIHVVPSVGDPIHPDLEDKVTFHGPETLTPGKEDKFFLREAAVWLLLRWPHPRGSGHAHRLAEWLKPGSVLPPLPPPPIPLPERLAQVVREIRPDIVHSLFIQPSGYETLAAHKLLGDEFPTWIVGNWGSDIYFYGQLEEHREHIKEVLVASDYLASECERDVTLARQFGFTGHALPVISAAGGFDLARWRSLRQPGPTSSRRVILLKGYQHLVGRSLVGLRALELCADVLQGYRIVVQLASPDVMVVAEHVSNKIGIPIETFPHAPYMKYEDVMRRYGRARIHIGLSISDGISQSLLEAMVMGAFPIQSWTACANEWFEDGKGGLLVPPEDPHIIAEAIRRAITDDALVDQGVQINDEMARTRLEYALVKERVVEMYKSVYEATNTTPFEAVDLNEKK